ncbi:hypothetical protein [Aeromicrobium ginsengisoli]|uniref:Uncharacterized protein n=1 Tax=Aeromicrobium ginsengisoli TaxID=363867 RepID=A0A5M4FGT0_9ACTN|nr:hypothetical protein [Aeromicrobium ginsengisoli]KAA1399271.1 hypothetical protein ESP70_000385 [Aeromicrobium ginsengisoli]
MQSERLEKVQALRLPDVVVRLSASPEVFDVGDDGSFHATFDFSGYVVAERRPHSGSEWENDDDREHETWTEGAWDWRMRLSEEIDPSQLATIRAQLAEPRPDHE